MHGGPSTTPCHGTPDEHVGDQAAAEAAPATRTILIVEDERVSRNALRKLLAASGYQPTAYESAEEALADMNGRDMPPVALIDVDLPGMSGLDLARRLEQLRPDMVRVLITAAAGDRIENFRRSHEVHYIRKPLDFHRLLTLLGDSKVGSRYDC